MQQPLKSDTISLARLAPLQAVPVAMPPPAPSNVCDGLARRRRSLPDLVAITPFRAKPPKSRGRVPDGGMVLGAPDQEPGVPPRPDTPGVPLPEVPVETPPEGVPGKSPPELPAEVPDESEPDFEEPVYPDAPPEIEPMTPPEIPAASFAVGCVGGLGNPR